MEREEKEKVKKREKKLEDEETMQQATWVKYTFPIKHQVGPKLSNINFSLELDQDDLLVTSNVDCSRAYTQRSALSFHLTADSKPGIL